MPPETLGSTLRHLREQADMSQEELAAKAQVSKNTIQNWERDRSEPRRAQFRRVAAALGMSADALKALRPVSEESPLTLEQIAEKRAELLNALAELDKLEKGQSAG